SDVEAAIACHGKALWPAQAAVPGPGVAVGFNGPDGVVGRERRPGDEDCSLAVDGQMISRDAGFECGVDKDLAVGVDLEYRPAAVSHKEVPFAVEGGASSHAHALGVNGELARCIDPVYGAFGAGGHEE